MKNRIAVISDIHSNADALMRALDEIAEKSINLTIFLGDLLTYGMQPLAVLGLLDRYKKENSSVFIKGNHDQFYFDAQRGEGELSYKMPEFVEESFLWTLDAIGDVVLEDLFDWRENYLIGDIYFAHANPFGYGDWRYLECETVLAEAFDELAIKKCSIGIFGHSHRQMISLGGRGSQLVPRVDRFFAEDDGPYIVNAGSVGQPRGKGFCYLTLEIDDNSVSGEMHSFDCDTENMSCMILSSEFSKETKDKLLVYLRS